MHNTPPSSAISNNESISAKTPIERLEEKTTVIAEWMGWEKRIVHGFSVWFYGDEEKFHRAEGEDSWNPYKSEQDARQAIEKLMENEKLFLKFLSHFVVLDSVSDGRKSITNYMKSTLTERMDALVSVISNSPPKL